MGWSVQLIEIQQGHPIARDNLMSLEVYDAWRQQHKAALMAHRRRRSAMLGAQVMVQFEDEITVRYQIQEMLRIEKIFQAPAIQHEIEAYAPLVPNGHNWKATMMIECVDAAQRQSALRSFIGIEDHMYVQVQDFECVKAIADEDMDRESANKTAAVHFLRFEFSEPMRQAIQAGVPVRLGCDHPQYTTHMAMSDALLQNLRADLH